jgi:endonuclease/exonuclease/phosphatase family metal-dependent hydrolase
VAKKKAKPKSGWRSSSILWMIITAISGGGVTGYVNPELPILGPIVKNLVAARASNESAALTGNPEDRGDSYTNGRVLTSAQAAPAFAGPALSGTLNAQPAYAQPTYAQPTYAQPTYAQRPNDKLLIATFNIQVFGASKLAKREAMAVIVQVIRHFDIVAIQEVRAKEDNILPSLVNAINEDGSRYGYLIGPRLGRSVSTEQYAFVYDTNRVEYDPSCVGTVQDPSDLLHREPFVARFRPRTDMPERAFSFWLVNIHTDPDEVATEIAALADVFQSMRSARPDEDDVILLGDLNASETQLGKLGKIPGMRWVVSGAMTNTRRTKAYDNILFDGPSTSEFTGRWGVFDLEKAFRLTMDQALEVSDHSPVWAEFDIWESPQRNQFSGRNPQLTR